MFRHVLILILSAVMAWPVPRASSKAELQALVRLPRLEFAPPLQFDRRSGFVIFPDPATGSSTAAKLLAEVKPIPAEAPKYLEAARLHESNGDFAGGLKHYARATDLFRKRVEADPNNTADLAGLAEALVALGRATEAQTHMDKALVAAPENHEVLLAAARFYQERSWQTLAGDQRLFSGAAFLSSISELLRDFPDATRLAESRRFLSLAEAMLNRIPDSAKNESAVHRQRSTFLSFRSALEELFRQAQSAESKILDIRKRLFDPSALEALNESAQRSTDNPELLITATLVNLYATAYENGDSDNLLLNPLWPRLNRAVQEQAREYCVRLEAMAESGSKSAPAAAEALGCARLYLLGDVEGASRAFRQALHREPRRNRGWEMLVLTASMTGDPAELLESCQWRFDSLPNARSSIFLAKAYDRNSDAARAELVCLASLAAHPNDFYLNLSLAALLLKRADAANYLWRTGDLLKKAEKQITASSSTQRWLDFAVIKSIYLALSDKPEEARATLQPFLTSRVVPAEVREVLRVLDR